MAKKTITEQEAKAAAEKLTNAVGSLRQLEAEMNEKMNDIRISYEQLTSKLKEDVQTQGKIVSKYAGNNPDIFGTKKTVDWGSVVITKRITPPKVDIPRTMDWEEALEKLKENGYTRYIRQIEEVDKDGIIRDVSSMDVDKSTSLRGKLAQLGITVTQTEKINVEVKQEGLVTLK